MSTPKTCPPSVHTGPTPARVKLRLVANTRAEGDCIVSLYSVGSHGYSQIGWSSDGVTVMRLGHRIAWEIAHGPVPPGMTVDHVCKTRRCVNVRHLRLLSNVDNARDNGFAGKTHCPAGHAYSGANLYTGPAGDRRCRACAKVRRAN